MRTGDFLKLAVAIAVSELAGVVGSVFTAPSIAGWYADLIKPAFNPPAWVFGPVWTILFILMGVAAFLVWRRGMDRRDVRLALGVFVGQLVLNTLWTIIFFGLRSPGGAFIEILLLWVAILATIILFAKISKSAAWLLVPYILWVSFAGYLNYSIWQANPSAGVPSVCDYPVCPGGGDTPVWKTVTDSKTGITFKYPENILTEYIHTVDWPPQVEVVDEPFVCNEAGTETARAGRTERRMVDDRVYCVTKVTEGAAGSIYTLYAYAFPKDNKTVILTFSLQAVQCVNYDDPQKTACENEREVFDTDGLIDRIVRTIRFATPTPVAVSGGIRGIVMLGPTCPVMRNPPDPQCADKPYATRLAVTTADQSRVITEFTSNTDGTFTVPLPPGKYAIRSAVAANILPYCSHDVLKVEANVFTDITVSCDTGIR